MPGVINSAHSRAATLSRSQSQQSNDLAYPSPPPSATSSRPSSRSVSRVTSPWRLRSNSVENGTEEEEDEEEEEENLPELDWKNIWSQGTDAVLDVPIGGVCEILYGSGRIRSGSFDSGFDEGYSSYNDSDSDAESALDQENQTAQLESDLRWPQGGKQEAMYGRGDNDPYMSAVGEG